MSNQATDPEGTTTVETADLAQVTQPTLLRTPTYVPYASEVWLHRTFLVMAVGVIALSFFMTSKGDTQVFMPGSTKPMPETCTSKRLFGIDCPGCGLTRSFISISHGHFSKAWKFNAAGFLVYGFVFVQIPWHAAQLWRIKNKRMPMQPFLIYLLPVAVAVALMITWIIKVMPSFGF